MLKVNKIKELMKEKGILQKDLADAAEVDQSFICLMLKGKRTPSPGTFNKIAIALGVTMEELVD